MARRTLTMWVAAVAAAALTACGTAPVQSSQFDATDDGSGQEAPTANPEETEPNEPDEQAHSTDPNGSGDDGEPPWHLLPEADRPEPVEQPECGRASPTPVAC
jgi:hypothetical protein